MIAITHPTAPGQAVPPIKSSELLAADGVVTLRFRLSCFKLIAKTARPSHHIDADTDESAI